MKSVTACSDIAATLEMQATLWRCERCNSFIAIHSLQPVVLPTCPMCIDSMIEYYGILPPILGLHVADA